MISRGTRRVRATPVRLDGVRRIVVYGADRGGTAALDLALVCGWEVAGFVDDRERQGGRRVCGLPVRGTRTLRSRRFDLIVVSPQLTEATAAKRLTRMGFHRGRDFVFATDPLVVDGRTVKLDVAAAFRSGARVVLFGTGQAAVAGMGVAHRSGWQIVYCVDNNPDRWETTFGDWKVRRPEALRNRDFDLILVCSLPGRAAIFAQLNQLGFEHQRHYLYYGEL